MYDSSERPNVDDLGLEEEGEIAYATQMAAREKALHAIFGESDPPDQIMSPSNPNLFVNQGEIDKALSMGKGTEGSIVLCRVLQERGVGFDSLPDRPCLTKDSAFAETWARVQSECESEWAEEHHRPPE